MGVLASRPSLHKFAGSVAIRFASVHPDIARLFAVILLTAKPHIPRDLPWRQSGPPRKIIRQIKLADEGMRDDRAPWDIRRRLSAVKSLLVDELVEKQETGGAWRKPGRPAGTINALSERILAADWLLDQSRCRGRDAFLANALALYDLGIREEKSIGSLRQNNRELQEQCFNLWVCAVFPSLLDGLFRVWLKVVQEAPPPGWDQKCTELLPIFIHSLQLVWSVCLGDPRLALDADCWLAEFYSNLAEVCGSELWTSVIAAQTSIAATPQPKISGAGI